MHRKAGSLLINITRETRAIALGLSKFVIVLIIMGLILKLGKSYFALKLKVAMEINS